MNYDFLSDEAGKQSKKPYALAAIIIIGMAIVGFGISSTGNITGVCSSFNDCKAKTQNSADSLESCTSEKSSLTAENKDLDASLSICQLKLKDAEKYKSLYSSQANAYKELVGNTAMFSCCTKTDSERGAIKGFNVVSNSVQCGPGEYAVNCKTGGTNYQTSEP